MFQATIDKQSRIAGEGADFERAAECLRAASGGRQHRGSSSVSATLNKAEQRRFSELLATLRQEMAAEATSKGGENVVAFPGTVQAEPRKSYRLRIMRRHTSPVSPAAEIVTADGEVLTFTGCGRPFICTDELEEPEFHGAVVQWAYYA